MFLAYRALLIRANILFCQNNKLSLSNIRFIDMTIPLSYQERGEKKLSIFFIKTYINQQPAQNN